MRLCSIDFFFFFSATCDWQVRSPQSWGSACDGKVYSSQLKKTWAEVWKCIRLSLDITCRQAVDRTPTKKTCHCGAPWYDSWHRPHPSGLMAPVQPRERARRAQILPADLFSHCDSLDLGLARVTPSRKYDDVCHLQEQTTSKLLGSHHCGGAAVTPAPGARNCYSTACRR